MFNGELAMDLVWLESRMVLHIECTHTKFRGAAVLRCKNVEVIRKAFLEFWATIYTGMPKVIRGDQEYETSSNELRK